MTGDGPELVVVSGAAGVVGRAVAEELQRAGYRVRGVDRRDGTLGVDEMMVGEASDTEFAERAMEGAVALVHLAAQPSPDLVHPERTFLNNVPASFSLCHAAAEQGVRRIVAASSISILGMAYAPRDSLVVPYLPVDEEIPIQPADTYALSKAVDETMLATLERRFGVATLALRMPFVGTGRMLRELGESAVADPAPRARELWGYLDTRDAARAFLRAVQSGIGGSRVLNIVSPVSLGSVDVERLTRAMLPSVELRRAIQAGAAAYTVEAAEAAIGFRAEWCWCGALLADGPHAHAVSAEEHGP